MTEIKIIFGPEVDAAITALIDYVEPDRIPVVLSFLERIQTRLVKTLSTFPESGARFQGETRMMAIEGYTFLYEYHRELGEVHVLALKGPGQNWR